MRGWRERARWAVVVAALAVTSGCWWAQTGFSPGRTFANPGPDGLTAENVGTVTPRPNELTSVEVVAGGRVLGFEGNLVTAAEARTGEVVWQQPLAPVNGRSPVLVHDGVVYVSGYNARNVCQFPPPSPPIPPCGSIVTDQGLDRFDAATGTPLPRRDWGGTPWGPVGPMAASGRWLVTLWAWFPPRFGPGHFPPDSVRVHDLTGAVPDRTVPIASQTPDLLPAIDATRERLVVRGTAGIESWPLDCAADLRAGVDHPGGGRHGGGGRGRRRGGGRRAG